MILDDISNLDKYSSLYPGFKKALAFIARNRSGKLADGKHAIDGTRVFALVSTSKGRGFRAKLEAHRKYIDIQYVISEKEVIGHSLLGDCRKILNRYDREKDIMFFNDTPKSLLVLGKGDFAVFFPHDAHAPLAGKGAVKKIVVKVSV
jgi:YhcH/YjgK/YiaL family protein